VWSSGESSDMKSNIFRRISQWAKALKADIIALWFAYRDSRTPWYAKLWTALVVGYAFCPIDLIPDFIPVLGYVDDVILLPVGILVAIRLIPRDVLVDSRSKAQIWLEEKRRRPKNWVAAALVILLWSALFLSIFYVTLRYFAFA
jgi:uncharacterized membrane protein YkvA (DUF1232 family)